MKRLDAARAGLLKYQPDKPCRAGHTSERYTSTGNCVACQNNVRQVMRQARNAQAMGWPDIATQVPMSCVALLRRLVSLLRYEGPESADVRAMLGASANTIAEGCRDFRDVDCLQVSGGRAPPDRILPPPIEDEPIDNGEPGWHRDHGFKSLPDWARGQS